MRTTAQAIASDVVRSKSRFADYVELTKPRLNFLVLLTTMAGFYLGSRGSLDVALMIHTLVGTALVAASASGLNQYLERDADAKMRRTEDRPLPAGRLEPYEAFWFGVITVFAGTAYLAIAVNIITDVLAWFTWFSYLFFYTPLKTKSPINTLVGAIPGALPPMIGWVAARNSLSVESLVLFGILFFWQFPHFLAIAWLYRDDYDRGGFKMLSCYDKKGLLTGRCMTAFSVILLGVSLLPTVLGFTGSLYLWGAMFLGIAFLVCSLCCVWFGVQNHAKRVFWASVIYQPLLLALMALNKT